VAVHGHGDMSCSGVFDRVGQCFSGQEVSIGLDGLGQSVGYGCRDSHRQRRTPGQCIDGRAESSARQDRWVNARRQFAQLLQCGAGLLDRIVEERPVLVGTTNLVPSQLQSEQQSDQPLLDPVVKIARQLMTRRSRTLEDASLGRP